MKQLSTKLLLFLFIFLFSYNSGLYSQSQSIYVIKNINANPTPIQAYAFQGNTIVFQAEYEVPYFGWGAVGIGIDSDAGFLFITYENSNVIQLLDATTMTDEGITTAPGADNLAGIVYDRTNTHVYTVDRETPKLYSYIWDTANKTLTLDSQIYLQSANVWGIFLDDENGLLYAANGSTITYYNTDDWSLVGTYNNLINNGAINVEKDIINNFLYYGGSFANNDHLVKYDLNTGIQTDVYLGNDQGIMGITINQLTGLIYITTGESGDDIRVFDKNLNMLYQTTAIGDPTDIATGNVGYNPLNFMIDSIGCIVPDDTIVYSLCYENPYLNDATNVTIVAEMPDNTSYVTSSNGGVYNSVSNEVTWTIGTVPAGTPQTCYILELYVSPSLPVPSIITFEAIINGDYIGSTMMGPTIITLETETCDIPTAIMSGDTTICFGETAELTVLLQGISPWEIIYYDGNNQDTISNINQSPHIFIVIPVITTNYSLLSVLGGNGLSNFGYGSATVIVNPLPNPLITGLDSVGLFTQGVEYVTPNYEGDEYFWNVQNGNIVSGQNTNNILVNWLTGNNAYVNVVETITETNCSESYNLPIIFLPTALMSGDTSICLGETAELTVLLQGIPLWEIIYSDGNNQDTISNINQSPYIFIVSPVITTNYSLLSVLGGNGLSNFGYGSATVIVNPVPIPLITGLDSVCAFDQGISYITQNHQEHAYFWNIINGTIVSGQNSNNITIDWLSGNNAFVIVDEKITETGCSKSDTLHVIIHHKPLIGFITNDTTLCPLTDTLILFPVDPGENYTLEWTCSDISSPWHEYTDDTIYIYTTGVGFYYATFYLNIFNNKGCCDEDSIHVVFDFSACGPYVNELDIANKISIYPNPCNDIINIEFNPKEFNYPIKIILSDDFGKALLTKEIKFVMDKTYIEKIDISSLSKGLYFINITGHDIILVKKIIKY